MPDASAHDSLGDEDLAAYRSVLEELRTELEHREALKREGADIPIGDITYGKQAGKGSGATERFEDVAIHGQVAQQLAAVEQALARIEAGEFGVCPGCNQAIPIDRLNIIPWAATCVSCA
mgnify:CR=1 FL=1